MVVAIVVVAAVLRRLRGSGPAPVASAVVQIAAFKAALITFAEDTGHYPDKAKGLAQLLQQPQGTTNWHGPYLDSDTIPKDPWGHDYIYEVPGRHNTNSFDLMSPGPDGRPGTKDDIANWTIKN